MEKILENYVTKGQLADEIGITVRTLNRWMAQGYGPPHTKMGSKTLYHVDTVREWLRSNEREPLRQWG